MVSGGFEPPLLLAQRRPVAVRSNYDWGWGRGYCTSWASPSLVVVVVVVVACMAACTGVRFGRYFGGDARIRVVGLTTRWLLSNNCRTEQ